MPQHQKVEKRSQKIQSIQDKRKYTERKLGGKRRNAENQRRNWVEGRTLRSAGGKGRQKQDGRCGDGGRASGTASWRRKKRQQCFADRRLLLGGLNALPCVLQSVQTRPKVQGKWSSSGAHARKRWAEPVSMWCHSCQARSIKLHRRVVWSLIFSVFGMYLVKTEVQKYQAHKGIARDVPPDRQDGPLGMRKEMMVWEKWCRKPKREKNSQGKDPRTFKENRQGRDLSTLELKQSG